jgi:hypothetical protein
MTRQEAKELSLEVWRYLAEHPEIWSKGELPYSIYVKIKDMFCRCPLCELFSVCGRGCSGCPLSGNGYYCDTSGMPYNRWWQSTTSDSRKEAAEEIVRLIEAWEVEA